MHSYNFIVCLHLDLFHSSHQLFLYSLVTYNYKQIHKLLLNCFCFKPYDNKYLDRNASRWMFPIIYLVTLKLLIRTNCRGETIEDYLMQDKNELSLSWFCFILKITTYLCLAQLNRSEKFRENVQNRAFTNLDQAVSGGLQFRSHHHFTIVSHFCLASSHSSTKKSDCLSDEISKN